MYELLDGEMCYGVRVGTTSVPDISQSREDVSELLALLSDNHVSEAHVYDVIEIWFAKQAYGMI